MNLTKKETIRLNRYLAMCGIAARRKSEEFIYTGRVSINGVVVKEPGRQVSTKDIVEFDNIKITPVTPTYLIYNKPKGLLSAVQDSRERTVIDTLPTSMDYLRIFPVGRLDKESEGLMILTNDGIFANKLMHPRNGVHKTYEVKLKNSLKESDLTLWSNGVIVEDKLLTPISVKKISKKSSDDLLEIVLGEGIKRQIRLMAKSLDNDVLKLFRRKIGALELRKLPAGNFLSVTKESLWNYIDKGKIV